MRGEIRTLVTVDTVEYLCFTIFYCQLPSALIGFASHINFCL